MQRCFKAPKNGKIKFQAKTQACTNSLKDFLCARNVLVVYFLSTRKKSNVSICKGYSTKCCNHVMES